MRNFINKIKNIGKAFNNFLKINPHKHWSYLLHVFFVLIFIAILFSIYFLYQIKNEKIFQVKVKEVEKQNLLKEDLLKKTVDFYDAKMKKESEIKNTPAPYKDPSI